MILKAATSQRHGTQGDVGFRPAFADEVARAASLSKTLTPLAGQRVANCFVALRSEPVERLVGAAFWRGIPSENEPESIIGAAEFEWSMVASYSGSLTEQEFLRALAKHVATQEPDAARLTAAAWIPEQSREVREAAALRQAGYEISARRRLYAIELASLTPLVNRDIDAMSLLPAGSSVETPSTRYLPALKELLCRGPGSLRARELEHALRSAGGESPFLFDARCSTVLLEEGKAVAACLADFTHDELKLAALEALPGCEKYASLLLQRALEGAARLGAPCRVGFFLDECLAPGPLTRLASVDGVKRLGTVVQLSVGLS